MSDEEEHVPTPKKSVIKRVATQKSTNLKTTESTKSWWKTKEKKKLGDKGSTSAKAIDVEALLSMGTKSSVTAKTLASMTKEQNDSIMGTAEKELLVQARKGLRDETMGGSTTCDGGG
jgi:hypothetical protein